MALDLYFFPLSQPSRAVWLFLKQNGIDFTPHVVSVMDGETHTDEYKKINPNGQVPAIVDGDFTLTEAAAILIYLCETRKVDPKWYPTDPHTRARIHQWMNWLHTHVRKGTMAVQARLGGKEKGNDSDEKTTVKSLEILNNSLANNKFVAGTDTMTVADLFLLPEVDQLHKFGVVDLKKYPNVDRWVKNVTSQIPSYNENLRSIDDILNKS